MYFDQSQSPRIIKRESSKNIYLLIYDPRPYKGPEIIFYLEPQVPELLPISSAQSKVAEAGGVDPDETKLKINP